MSTRKEYPDRIEWTNKQGQRHRLDGPAVECINGRKEWYINGKRHREDGPAITWGSEFYFLEDEHWLNDKSYSKQGYEKELLKIRFKRIKNL